MSDGRDLWRLWELVGGPADGEWVWLRDGDRDYRIAAPVCHIPIGPENPFAAAAPPLTGVYRDGRCFWTRGTLEWVGWG
ncbi:MAG: hypothetical protein KGN74_06340 [Gemmatimonadota bacterium]|nr:hypothetical protein [Gemmatimonadota bacterium]